MSYNFVFRDFHSLRGRVARKGKRRFIWPIRTAEQCTLCLGGWAFSMGRAWERKNDVSLWRFFVEPESRSGSFIRKLAQSRLDASSLALSFQGELKACVFAACTSPPLTSASAFVYTQRHHVTLLPCSNKFSSSIRFTITPRFISQESALAAVLLSFPPCDNSRAC